MGVTTDNSAGCKSITRCVVIIVVIATREENLAAIRDPRKWDILVVGGGATGLGIALEASSRGHSTVLLEQSDFCKGTSSKSTKLIHGGVRYLAQGNLRLVVDALRERGLLLRNAPQLVKPLPMVLPFYRWWEGPYYLAGLKLYDALAGKLGVGRSRFMSRRSVLDKFPTIEPKGLSGGVQFYDGQFDDSRLGIALATAAVNQGAAVLNYLQVTQLLKVQDRVRRVMARDSLSGEEFEIRARSVINATGVFSDTLRKLDDHESENVLKASQGSHIVLDRDFLPGETAVLIPRTRDGRVLFAIPWHGKVLAGTTDIAVDCPVLEPVPDRAEIQFILDHLGQLLARSPEMGDVRSVFAGLRPLVKATNSVRTSALSRDHSILVSESGMVSVVGGKWTTYRKMAEDAVDRAERVSGLKEVPTKTKETVLDGRIHPSDGWDLSNLETGQQDVDYQLHQSLPYRVADVIAAVRYEWAQTIEDVLSRRTRALLLDARVSLEVAPRVAEIMAAQLKKNNEWKEAELSRFKKTAQGYLPGAYS